MPCRTSNETRTMVLLLLLLTGSIPSTALSLVPSNPSFSRPGFLHHNRRHFPISTCRGDVPDQLSSHCPFREGVLLQSTARSRSDPYDDEDDFDDDDDEDERKYARVRRGGRRRRSRYLDDDDDYEFDSEYDDDYEADFSRRRGGRGFGERDDLYDEEEEEGDEEEEDEEDLLSGELIPNPILDSIDPDGASERFGDLFSDSKFWRDLAIFVTFVWVIEAITVPF